MSTLPPNGTFVVRREGVVYLIERFYLTSEPSQREETLRVETCSEALRGAAWDGREVPVIRVERRPYRDSELFTYQGTKHAVEVGVYSAQAYESVVFRDVPRPERAERWHDGTWQRLGAKGRWLPCK